MDANTVIAGVPLIAAVIILTEVVKRFVKDPQYMPVVAIVISVVLCVLVWTTHVWPMFAGLLDALVVGIAVGGTATGLYRAVTAAI